MSISAERDKRQAKVFTRWCNSHLKKKGVKLTKLEDDFDNGVNLNLLYAVISGDSSLLKRVRMKPRSRIESTANLSLVLQKINQFVKEVGIGLSYSPTQIADGDIKQICGMLWILITKFVIPESEENLSAKRSLLRWVQRVTEPYDNVDVKDFHKSWKDGLAFNALLDQFDNTLMDYTKLKSDEAEKNCQNAFDVAEKLGIYKLLDVEDITEVERPDEKSVMTYVSTMYQFFHSNANKKLEQDCKNFVIDCKRLIDWIKQSIEKHQIPEAWPEELEPCYQLEKDVGAFNVQKARYANYKSNLYVRLAGIQRTQRNERLKVFVPDDDSNLNTVHKTWQELNEVVVKYTKELREQIDKLEEEKRQREEAAIKAQEDEERRKRKEFTEKVEKEIKEREAEEGKTRDDENEFLGEDKKKDIEKVDIQRDLVFKRDAELVLRKEQEERKRREAAFREEEKERLAKEEELRKKKEEEKEKRLEELKKAEEEQREREERERKEREEFRKRVDKEIEDRENEDKKEREDEINFYNEDIAKGEEKEKISFDLVSQRESEHRLREEQEKAKRVEAARKKKVEETEKEAEEFRKQEEENRKQREEEKQKQDDEINKKMEEDRKERENERKKKEDDLLAKEDAERKQRKDERDKKYNDAKNKEQMERKAIGEYDVVASEFLKWVVDTQENLTSHFEELEEDKEDLSTDKEIRKQRVDAVAEAKEKIKPVLEKWKELEEMKITEWSSIPKDEAVHAMETMAYALCGEESDSLGKIRKFKMDAEKKEE